MKHVFVIDSRLFREQNWKMEGLLDSIGQYFRTQERPNFSTLVTKFPREAIGLIQKQVDEAEAFETVRVYAVGGDDILFDCLNGITELQCVELAIMPYGSANNFIRTFGEGKAELFKDIHSFAEASVLPTDMIKVGNNYALNGCAVGFTPAVAIKLRNMNAKFEKGLNRFTAALWFFLSNLISIFDSNIVAHNYNITIDDNDHSGHYSLIIIANSPYFGRKKVSKTEAKMDDGLMDIVLFKSASILTILGAFRKYSRGKMPSSCVHVQASKVTIKADKPMCIQTDSEYLMDTSITFEVIPNAVQVVAVHDLTYQRF